MADVANKDIKQTWASIVKTLKELEEIDDNLSLVIGRELTKKFERVYRGSIKEIQEELDTDSIKGEFVVIVGM